MSKLRQGVPVVHKVQDCNIKVTKIELQSLYYDHFRNNTLGKKINPLIPSIHVCLNGTVFTNSLGTGFNPRSSHIKDSMVLDTYWLIRYGSRVKCSSPRKGVAPSSTSRRIQKVAFGSPLTTVANFTYLFFYYNDGFKHWIKKSNKSGVIDYIILNSKILWSIGYFYGICLVQNHICTCLWRSKS